MRLFLLAQLVIQPGEKGAADRPADETVCRASGMEVYTREEETRSLTRERLRSAATPPPGPSGSFGIGKMKEEQLRKRRSAV